LSGSFALGAEHQSCRKRRAKKSFGSFLQKRTTFFQRIDANCVPFKADEQQRFASSRAG
jgi:hypothetical protein